MPAPTIELRKFISPCPPPEGYQREVLEILIEECAEVVQRATKMLRFGIEEVQPGLPHSNLIRLSREVGDLVEMIDMGVKAGLLSQGEIDAGRESKRMQLKRFLQNQPAPVNEDDGSNELDIYGD